jgi:hypothetical protein
LYQQHHIAKINNINLKLIKSDDLEDEKPHAQNNLNSEAHSNDEKNSIKSDSSDSEKESIKEEKTDSMKLTGNEIVKSIRRKIRNDSLSNGSEKNVGLKVDFNDSVKKKIRFKKPSSSSIRNDTQELKESEGNESCLSSKFNKDCIIKTVNSNPGGSIKKKLTHQPQSGSFFQKRGSFKEVIDDIDSLNYNIWDFEHKKDTIMQEVYIFVINSVITQGKEPIIIDMVKTKNFINQIQQGYISQNPYHNEIHGTDILQTIFSWFENCNIARVLELGKYDLMAIYTAAVAHDYGHPGFNNNYLMNSKHDIAITYNDKSVLENYHSAETFKILLKPENNIFEDLNYDEFKLLRNRIIESILATDMSMHFHSISKLKGKIDYLEIDHGNNIEKLLKETKNSVFSEQQEVINFLIHSADVSHNSKPWNISKIWSRMIYDEFFHQGDLEKEKGLPVSMFCDRETANISGAQVGFITGIIIPTFQLLVRLFPDLNCTLENLEKNNENWQEKLNLIKEYKK